MVIHTSGNSHIISRKFIYHEDTKNTKGFLRALCFFVVIYYCGSFL